ncbi:MAG: hypothetical protein R3F62_16540 [Planctomycetota bacterium]
MDPLRRWLAFTCRKNPSFPLSTLLLALGLWTLSGEEEADAANLLGIAAGLGVIAAFLATLLGLAGWVLWPRRVLYETASALRVATVFRYALPFVVTSYAVDGGDPLAAALLGLAVTGFVVGAGELVVRRVGLPLAPWERGLDHGLYALAAVGFPLLAHGLAFGAQGAFAEGRLAALGAWWGLALLLVPLVLGLGTLAPARPLRSRLTAYAARGVALLALPALLWHALWTAGQEPPLVAYLPLALVLQLALVRGAQACGAILGAWADWGPGVTLLGAIVLPETTLLGRAPACGQALAVLALAPLAAGACCLLPRRASALRIVGAAVAGAPLVFVRTPVEAAGFLFVAGVALALVGLARRRGATVAHGALLAGASGTFLAHAWGLPLDAPALAGALGCGALLAVRGYDPRPLAGVSALLFLGPWSHELALGDPSACLATLGVGLALAGCAWAGGCRWLALTALGAGGVLGLRLGLGALGPGVVLVLLGFGGLPAGAWVGIRREQRLEAA